jgi:hypothetical protein
MSGSIIIQPFARKLRDGERNAKDYPWWAELLPAVSWMTPCDIIQIGVSGEQQLVPDFRIDLSYSALQQLIRDCDTFICGDSFLQHLGWSLGKQGIVLWGKSDPLIFGHPENINLLADRANLRSDQFGIWEGVSYSPEVFVSSQRVLEALCTLKL